jgi:hypothetical protein
VLVSPAFSSIKLAQQQGHHRISVLRKTHDVI